MKIEKDMVSGTSTRAMRGMRFDEDEVNYGGKKLYIYLDEKFLDISVECGIYFEMDGE